MAGATLLEHPNVLNMETTLAPLTGCDRASPEALSSILEESFKTSRLRYAGDEILSGFSGEKLVGLLQRLSQTLNTEREAYLEVGVFQGLTLLSVALANREATAIGVDNFSLFNEGGANRRLVEERRSKLNLNNARLLEADFEEALLQKLDTVLDGRQIGVYFVDGPHDYRSQLLCLLQAIPRLAHGAVILVDDANYAHVRQATVDFLRLQTDFALAAEAYTPAHPANLSGEVKEASLAGWWNGVHVIVHDPKHCWPRQLPEVPSRDIYFQSHEVFRHELAEAAEPILNWAQKAIQGEAEMQLLKGVIHDQRRLFPGRFPHRNTGSENLPAWKIHR